MTRTTEQIAPEQLAQLTEQLTHLTTNQSTTAEIEEALMRTVPAITRALADWLRSRHTVRANAHRAGAAVRIPDDDEGMDRLEPIHLGSGIFAPNLDQQLGA